MSQESLPFEFIYDENFYDVNHKYKGEKWYDVSHDKYKLIYEISTYGRVRRKSSKPIILKIEVQSSNLDVRLIMGNGKTRAHIKDLINNIPEQEFVGISRVPEDVLEKKKRLERLGLKGLGKIRKREDNRITDKFIRNAF